MNKAKFFTITGLIATSVVAVGAVAAGGPSIHFIQATNKKTVDIVPLLANAIAEGEGNFFDEHTISLNGISYTFEVCDVSVTQSGASLSIGPGGFIRNVTAFNGLAVDAFTTSDSDISNFAVSVGEFSKIETDYGEIDFQNCLSGSSIVGGTYTDENICLVNNGSTSKVITSFKMSHNCITGDKNNTKVNVNVLVWDEEMYFNSGESDGSSEHPYLINGFAAYEAFADMTNKGNTLEDVYFKLTSDLDYASAERICPSVGSFNSTVDGCGFGGVFDGNKKTITLDQVFDVSDSVFGVLTETGEIFDLTVDGTIKLYTGSGTNGGICSENDGFIHDCVSSVSFVPVATSEYIDDLCMVGGIAAFSGGIISDCVSNISIKAHNPYQLGGICGCGYGDLYTCSFFGEMHISFDQDRFDDLEEWSLGYIGGIVGEFDGEWDQQVNLTGAILDYPHDRNLLGYEENKYCGRAVGFGDEETIANYQDPYLYLVPNIWDAPDANEDYYIFRWGNDAGEAWVKLSLDSVTNLYRFEASTITVAAGFLLARVDGGKEPEFGKTVWNQTIDLNLPKFKNVITISSWHDGKDGKSTIEWGTR